MSEFKIVYVDTAREDLTEASSWYKQQRSGLDKLFRSAIQKAFRRLLSNPYAFAIRYRNVRIIHPETFPYGIHFYIDEALKAIVIVSILHDYRDVGEM
ncbi:MAG: type II toxin-antitoxin system RelE/ParE family toxin [Taibaiella sp.]|nr:type II toxin-antitoxin system RelE/ParE family toxin [Taibaiella sp.]